MSERNPKSKFPRATVSTLAEQVAPLADPPLLLPGEDPKAYEQLRQAIYATIKPACKIEQLFADDAVRRQWDLGRLDRLKNGFMRRISMQVLEDLIAKNISDDEFRDLVKQHFPERYKREFDPIAVKAASDQAYQEVMRSLREPRKPLEPRERMTPEDMLRKFQPSDIWHERRERAKPILLAYERNEPAAVKFVEDCLAMTSRTMDDVRVDATTGDDKLSKLERLEKLIAGTESARTAALHEIDWRRAVLAQKPRGAVHINGKAAPVMIEARLDQKKPPH